MKTLLTNKTWLFGFVSLNIILLSADHFSGVLNIHLIQKQLMQLVIATALFIAGQALIGPTLTPALGSIGLVVLVFASCMLQEKLTWYEYLSPPTHCISHDLNSSLISLIYLGIFIMTGSVVMLGFSKMVIKQAETDFLEPYFLLRVTIS